MSRELISTMSALEESQVHEEFESEAPATLRALRRCVGQLIGALPGGGVHRAVNLSERLALDSTLGWKVWRIGFGEGQFPSPKHIPGRAGMMRFLEAAAAAGVPDKLIEETREAFSKFQKLATSHADDRAGADILLATMTEEGRKRLEHALRRDAFRGNTHFLGVRASCLYQLDIVLPGPDGYMPEVMRVRSLLGLTRTRPGARWLIGRSTLIREDGPSKQLVRTPLDGPADGPGLLTDFCSVPTPSIVRRTVNGVTTEDELGPSGIGRGGAVDIVLGEHISHMPFVATTEDAVTMMVNTPAERLCYDVLLHEDAVAQSPLRFAVHTTIHGGLAGGAALDRDKIPVPEHLEALGRANTAPTDPNVQHHAALIEWVTRKANIDLSKLWVFRVVMKFPPIPTVLAVTYPRLPAQ